MLSNIVSGTDSNVISQLKQYMIAFWQICMYGK